jgi:hypothetical protein
LKIRLRIDGFVGRKVGWCEKDGEETGLRDDLGEGTVTGDDELEGEDGTETGEDEKEGEAKGDEAGDGTGAEEIELKGVCGI